MNVKIVGNWEHGWDTPLNEFERWKHSLLEFGVDTFYMSPITGILKPQVIEYVSTEEFLNLEENNSYTKVFCDDKADTSLKDFVHPTNAIYVFGRTSYDVLSLKQESDLSISIPTSRNAGGFFAHQACSIILYDRFLKEAG